MFSFAAIALKFLKGNWGWIWRGGAALIVAGILWYAYNTVMQWKEDSDALPLVKLEAAEELAKEKERSRLIQSQYQVAHLASERYQRELEDLRNAPRPPAPVIRVCKPAPAVRPGPASPTAARPDAAAPAAGVLQETVGFDTSPLYRDADRCDELSAQVRGLQLYETERMKQ